MPRTIVIGDIHGALKALQQLLSKIMVSSGDQFIFVGDYVDGWSQSADVIEYLAEFVTFQPCIFIKGNHDEWCLSWLEGNIPNSDWLLHGGRTTIKSYKNYPPAQRAKHLEFFHKLRNYYEDDSGRLFVHAGFLSAKGPSREPYESDYYWDRSLWEAALAADKKDPKYFPERLLLYKEIYIGHTPTLNYNNTVPMHACNVWNIDTGAGFYGKLSAIDIETKQYWQSDMVMNLYPGEKGRNK
jgi:serine/threonine protein phosphatase 1